MGFVGSAMYGWLGAGEEVGDAAVLMRDNSGPEDA